MINIYDLVWLTVLGLGVFYWWKSMETRQRLLRQVKKSCEQQGLLLLDQSISLGKIALRRNDRGQIRLWRQYDFEFTSTGEHRYHGSVTSFGPRIEQLHLEAHHIQ